MWKNKRILIVCSHPDDCEFGLGATMNQFNKKNVQVIVFSDTVNINGDGVLKEVDNSLRGVYGFKYTLMRDIINMNFANQGNEIRQKLYDVKQKFKPDIIFSTSVDSYNTDHKVLGESVLAVFQEQTVLFYEVVRGDYEFKPNFYNEVFEEDVKVKQRAIAQYVIQVKKRKYAKPSIIQSQLIYRGSQISKRYAESFKVGRIIL